MIRGSFIPPRAIRELRALTRRRKQLVRAGAQERNRVQKELEECNIKLGNVLSDLFGLSGQLMLEALVEGKANPEQIAQLAQRQARKKIPQIRAALEGQRMGQVQRELIQLSLQHMAVLEEQIGHLDETIFQHIRTSGLQTEHDLLQTIPGVKKQAAASMLAELGPDMKVFGNGRRCSSWSGVCPGNNESAGNKKRAPTLRGNLWLRSTLVECAWAGSNKKDSVLHHRYHHLHPRLGHKRAIVAVAHTLVLIAFDVLSQRRPFEGLGADPLPPQKLQRLIRHHTRRLRHLKRWLPPAFSSAPPAPPPAAT
jgi:transposase